MDGEEVVQLYISHQGVQGRAPLKALKGFQRISLKASESKIVSFTLTPEQLSLVSEDGKMMEPKGKVTISIGGGQPDVKNKTTSNVIKGSLIIN
jgi:beta-glucosidase